MLPHSYAWFRPPQVNRWFVTKPFQAFPWWIFTLKQRQGTIDRDIISYNDFVTWPMNRISYLIYFLIWLVALHVIKSSSFVVLIPPQFPVSSRLYLVSSGFYLVFSGLSGFLPTLSCLSSAAQCKSEINEWIKPCAKLTRGPLSSVIRLTAWQILYR